jgi:UDP-N-acetylmuramate dehydrogenase
MRIGTAEVSTKHANFVQLDAGGSAKDVYALIRSVKNRVREKTGIELSLEIQLIGFESS